MPKCHVDFLDFVPGKAAAKPEGHIVVPIRVINAASRISRFTYGLLDNRPFAPFVLRLTFPIARTFANRVGMRDL